MEKRYAASSLVIKDQLIITGGSNNHSRLNTSEIISDNLELGKLEDLPEPVFYHSALNINNTFSMITGGKIRLSSVMIL